MEVFDPEKLMERYMDMRTNQGLFGSYHPNDLVQSIIDYFSHGGKQSTADNQWGLFVYNPSDKMIQYMGNMKSPGNLGPQTGGNSRKGEENKSNAGFAFDPNTLNSQLLHEALTKGSEFSKFEQRPAVQSMAGNGGNLGFDPDALNKNMMSNAMKKGSDNGADNIRTTTPPTDKTTKKSDHASGSHMLGFNPDKLNAGLLNTINSQNVENGGISNMHSADGKANANMLGFNPDQVNANLISSLKYNPNSAAGNINNAMFGDNASSSKQTTGKSSAESGSRLTGNNDTQPTGNHRYTQHEASNPFQTNIGSGISNMFGVNKNDVISSSGEMKNDGISGFKAGGMGTQGYGKQNMGAPPGVPKGYELKQTESATAKAHGIGGLS